MEVAEVNSKCLKQDGKYITSYKTSYDTLWNSLLHHFKDIVMEIPALSAPRGQSGSVLMVRKSLAHSHESHVDVTTALPRGLLL